MTKKLILTLLCSMTLVGMCSCNSSADSEYTYEQSTSVLVSAFSLQANSDVLDSLQNVFFSINLEDGSIFNADSLPYGTKINRLVTSITAPTYASVVQLEYPRPNMSDSIVNYLTNSSDSIDFSNGTVKLRVKSESGTVEKVYNIDVNVHKVKPDTLAWSRMESAPLPTSFTSVDAQCTVTFGDVFYCLTESNGAYCLAKTTNPADPKWSTSTIALPFTPNIESMHATDDAVYMLDADGGLHKTVDFESWISTGETWSHIYGAYGNELLGVAASGSGLQIASYPSGSRWDVLPGMPVSGTSQPAIYDLAMADGPQLVMIGGRTADGELVSSAWGFDGSEWTQLSVSNIDRKLENMALVAYNLFDVPSSTWKPVQYPALIAWGGRNETGAVNRKVYMSSDWGMTWKTAPDLMQLPSDVPTLWGFNAYIYTTTMHASRAADGWNAVQVRGLYPGCQFVDIPYSRAVSPIEQWECPAIYIYGGRYPEGEVSTAVWRGMILRYTFQPKQ